MNIERLNAVKEAIMKTPDFSMKDYFHECGTPACIAGHAAEMYSDNILSKRWLTHCVAEDVLNLTPIEGSWLFLGKFSKKGDLHNITQLEAARAIEYLVDGGVVSPDGGNTYKTLC